jgi:glycosyltransferase involved in cell wall biosynthesis
VVVSSPRFSVIIPTYQHAEFIARTIGYVVDQTFLDFEIIVVDNGSTDGTDEAVGSIEDDRITYHWQEGSGLPANSRNVAVSMARGELVAFLDSDDVWYPQKLARVEEAFSARADLDVFCHGVEIISNGKPSGTRAYELAEGEHAYERLLYEGNFMTTSATVVRRDRFSEVGGFQEREDLVTVEDYDLWMRLARAGARFEVIPEILGEYTLHASNASANLERTYDNAFRALEEQYLQLAEKGQLDIDRAIGRRRRGRLAMIRDLTRAGHPGEAARWTARLPGELAAARERYASVSPGSR